jgi:cytidine deaminase
MDKRAFEIQYTVYKIEELAETDRIVLAKATEAALNAYAPYSNFRVGAAVLLDNGEIIMGNNQENVSYPQGLCAERVALFYAMAHYPERKIKTMAIYGNIKNQWISPCGGCRQVMLEYEGRGAEKMRIFLGGDTGEVMLIEGAGQLLPFQFSEAMLCPTP